jgi:hypothetical protein
MTRRVRLAALCFATLALALGLASAAQAFVYWGAPGASAIGRANLDGTGLNTSFVSGVSNPYGLAVDASHIYWADIGNGNIGRANLDGSGANQTFVTGASGPSAVAVDSTYVYWANSTGHTIGRAPLADPNGLGKDQGFVTTGPSSQPGGLAVNATHIYWSDQSASTIGRTPLADPNGLQKNTSLVTGVNSAAGVAVDATYLYWVHGIDRIGRANLDGTLPNTSFISGLTRIPTGLAVDAAYVYWTNTDSSDANLGAIGRAALSGMSPNEIFISPGSRPDGVAVDAGVPPPQSPGATSPATTIATGQRAAALKKCKKTAKKKDWTKKRLRKCKKKARLLPV